MKKAVSLQCRKLAERWHMSKETEATHLKSKTEGEGHNKCAITTEWNNITNFGLSQRAWLVLGWVTICMLLCTQVKSYSVRMMLQKRTSENDQPWNNYSDVELRSLDHWSDIASHRGALNRTAEDLPQKPVEENLQACVDKAEGRFKHFMTHIQYQFSDRNLAFKQLFNCWAASVDVSVLKILLWPIKFQTRTMKNASKIYKLKILER